MQSALSRRQEILNVLMYRRQDTVSNLAFEFHVSKRTIRRDICILSREHSIETYQGNGGGIRVADGYYADRRYLNDEQEDILGFRLGAKITMECMDENDGDIRGVTDYG